MEKTFNTPSFKLSIALQFIIGPKNPVQLQIHLSVHDNDLTIVVKSKQDLARILILIDSPNPEIMVSWMKLLINNGSIVVTAFNDQGVEMTRWDQEGVNSKSWLAFLGHFKNIDIWADIQRTGYHELLPEE